jgi:hypothetical protein
MAYPAVHPTSASMRPLFRRGHALAQLLGVGLTLVLLAGLVARPAGTLHVLWDMVIPLLPAVFLLNPMLWRNVCPLATLNTVTGQRVATRPLDGQALRMSWALGIVLLFVMVPARRFLFNVDGQALAATIVAVALLALAGGLLYARRAGFCNAICPVLPVEKLYGQHPLVRLPSARCAACTLCTPSGCLDVAGDKTLMQTLGPARRSSRWLGTPFGLFSIAFPGFIIGYFTSVNGPLSTAPAVYLHVLAWSAATVMVLGSLLLAVRVTARAALPLLGALAFGLYYWFGAPALARAYGGGDMAGLVLRIAAGALLAVWLVRCGAEWRTPSRPSAG